MTKHSAPTASVNSAKIISCDKVKITVASQKKFV
jgi:hypothetical protein